MIMPDTHVLVWWASDPDKLSKPALKAVDKEKKDGTIIVSSISIWEIYMLVAKNRLKLTLDTDTRLKKN